MKTLKPIRDFDRYSDPITDAIYARLFDMIFRPLYSILEIKEENTNAMDSQLKKALREGRVQYVDGYFFGAFSAAISRELIALGAKFNKIKKGFKLDPGLLPSDILGSIMDSRRVAREQLNKIEDFLTAIEGQQIEPVQLDLFLDQTLDGLNKQFKDTTKELTPKDLEIRLNPRIAASLKDTYSENMDLNIKDWHDEQVMRLRSKVAKNVAIGYRAENLIQDIQTENRVSYNKAKFLARQETSLMVAKYRQAKYEDIGLRRYMWSSSNDQRVRPDHRELHGKIFSFDKPPISNKDTGERNNPGEDYGCRCTAIPIVAGVNFVEVPA